MNRLYQRWLKPTGKSSIVNGNVIRDYDIASEDNEPDDEIDIYEYDPNAMDVEFIPEIVGRIRIDTDEDPTIEEGSDYDPENSNGEEHFSKSYPDTETSSDNE